ncbi:MAG: DUF1311 domain-containing protein [Phenylobacterium sp.]|nr:MAG: DUF1311 domain-containing protein [Phenylobacterium sp.]
MAAEVKTPAERRGFLTRGSAEARELEVDLGEPLEDDDLPPMPNWRPPSADSDSLAAPAVPEDAPAQRRGRRKAQAPPAAAPDLGPGPSEDDLEAPPFSLDAGRPLSLWDADPAPIEDEAPPARADGLQMGSAPARRPKPSYRPRLRLVVGFALGIAVGAALGFWVGQMPPDRPPPAVAPVQTAALAPPPAPAPQTPAPIAAEPAPLAQPDAAAASTPTPDTLEPAHAADSRPADTTPAPPPAVRAEPEPAKSAEAAEPAPERSAPAVAAGCSAAPTPADRTICGDAKLRRLQEELRHAYADALDAHEDRNLLREHQLAWRDARSAVTDPTRLAQLYEERIRKLKAATAEALAGK